MTDKSKKPGTLETLATMHGELVLPAFLPDATRAVVRTIDTRDIKDCGSQAVMVNVIHLGNHPGISVLKQLGGVHKFMNWDGHVFCDSGGFQVFSLISEGKEMGSVSERGFVYRLTKGGKKKILTPEKSIRNQFQPGADVLFCLDYCTHPQADQRMQLESVRLTIDWAKRCKQEFDRLISEKQPREKQPLLFAVVQGGSSKELRKRCCDALLEIGFAGYGFGGWPIDQAGRLVEEAALTAELITAAHAAAPHPTGNRMKRFPPLHGLGIGKPENIAQAYRAGYRLFDCVLPTRDARHNRLYIYNDEAAAGDLTGKDFYSYLYIQDERYRRDENPPGKSCDCFCCRNYSRAYLHHLFKIEDPLMHRLATIHNLRFYNRLMTKLAAKNE